MNKNTFWLIVIMAIALVVRVYKLSELPYGFHVDEVKAGWNAWSIWKTGKNDFGNKLPMYYNSIGDFRPAGIIYLIIPFAVMLGRTVLATRLPAAILGALTVWPLYLLVVEVLGKKKGGKIGLFAGLFWAFSIWQIDVSRATSEAVVSSFLAIFGLYFLARTINKKGWLNVIWTAVFFGLSYMFYHSIRVTAPMLVLILAGCQIKKIKVNKTIKQTAAGVAAVILLTVIVMSQKEAQGRMSAITIFSDASINEELTEMPTEEGPGHVLEARMFNNKLIVYGRTMLNEYLSYFSPEFLVENSAKPIRYMIPNVGLITYAGLGLLIMGIVVLGQDIGIGMWWLMLLAAPIPAVITNEDIPNVMRTLLMVPFLVIIESYGLCFLMEIKRWGKILTGIVLAGWGINLILYFHMYYRHGALSIASYYRDGGNVELTTEILKLQNNFDQIYLPNFPDNMYPWIGYIGSKDPKSFNSAMAGQRSGQWRYENINFTSQHCPTDIWLKEQLKEPLPAGKILVVNAEGCQVDAAAAAKKGLKYYETIHRPDGSPPYMMWEKE